MTSVTWLQIDAEVQPAGKHFDEEQGCVRFSVELASGQK